MIDVYYFCHFSSLGTIRVMYTPRAGNRTALTSGRSLATAGADFVSLPMEATLEDMQQSAVISVDVLEVRSSIRTSYTVHMHACTLQ